MADNGFEAGGEAELRELFELAPVSLWLEDYGALRDLFDEWRGQGITDLRGFLHADPRRVSLCSSKIRLLAVNRRTLELFEADSLDHLVANLALVFRDDMLDQHVEELVQLWQGRNRFDSQTVNYSLSGRRLEILLHGVVLGGHEESWRRVLVSIEDITERSAAQRAQIEAERYARGLFEHSPVSLWVEDFSGVKSMLDEVAATGVTDFRAFASAHPEIVEGCMGAIRVIDVNRQTLHLFGAPDRASLLDNLDRIFRDDMRDHFTSQLVDLFDGRLSHQGETVNYSLAGERLDVYLQFSVLPGHEEDWSMVLISLIDITARKKAEAYLEYLGTHDALTKLRNRSYFADELKRLDSHGSWPATVLVIDLNNLKTANDQHGHATGDTLLRRAGEVLSKAVERNACVARIGGDEFALVLPGTDERGGKQIMERIAQLVEVNNRFYGGQPLSFAIGMATGERGTSLESLVREADGRMYASKRAYYERTGEDRRDKRLKR